MAIILPSLPRSPLLLLVLALVLLSSAHLPRRARAEDTCSASAPCANNLCCSKWGWCGSTVDHCGAGCQSGPCAESTSASPPSPQSSSPAPAPSSPPFPPPSGSPPPVSDSPPPPSPSPSPPSASPPAPSASPPPPTGFTPPPTGSAPPPTGSAPPPTSSAPPPTGSPPPSTGLQRMAYFPIEAGMDPSLIPAANLTHVFYSRASVDPTTYKVVPYIPAIDVNEGLYLRFNSALKTANPAIKTLLSIGGYLTFTIDFENVTSSPSSRSAFIQSAIALARTYNFDGLDLDWKIPTGNTTLFSTLLTEFRAAIESEAAASGKSKLLLSAVVSAYEPNITRPYDVPTLNKTLDFVNVQTFDFMWSWKSPTTGMHTALEDVSNPRLSIKGAMASWVSRGLARSKAMVGLAMYGHTWTLASTNSTGVGAPATGAGQEGSILFYKEINQMVTTGGYTATLDAPTSSMYAVKGDQWVCYDDPSTITTKVQFAKTQGYGGWFVRALGQDANNALLNAAVAAS
ncbi:unnamed protein product [Closterium sp. Naga37s-1]|nr:unnamed protein product [Closterium sp. Naga37s-1]